MERKLTLVVGASPEPSRYSHLATHRLVGAGHPVVLLGKRTGAIAGLPIQRDLDPDLKVHTITLYVAPQHQGELMDELLALRPQRIIFNPGTENTAFEAEARKNGIEVVEGCTLVMLASGQF
ncbi:MAG: CoA-binding protein [Flavobacteriales bacterium]